MLLSRFYKKFWLGNKRKDYIAILESKREQKIPLPQTKCLIATTKNLRETQFCFAWRDKTMSFSFELVRTELQTGTSEYSPILSTHGTTGTFIHSFLHSLTYSTILPEPSNILGIYWGIQQWKGQGLYPPGAFILVEKAGE